MTQIPHETPVLIGAAQFTERLDSDDYRALSPVDITAEAARRALTDAGMERRLDRVDIIMTTRTFEDSTPVLAFPFGRSNNFPRSVAQRLGIKPAHAVWATSGGDTPQKLVVEACEAIVTGHAQAVLIAGGEALSTGKHLVKQGVEVDWSEEIEAQVDDRGAAIDFLTADELNNGLITPPLFHGIIENARRGAAGFSREHWAQQMSELFAPFSAVAATNPLAAISDKAFDAVELRTPGPGNRLVADPYTQRLIARDQVNQSAAVIVVSSALADDLGVPQAQRVYLHGHAAAGEPPVTLRPDLGKAPSAGLALAAALEAAETTIEAIDLMDFYSCFPVAVTNAIEALGLTANDPRGLTVTGGLPYFGGPGNSYSLHALAEIVSRLRGGDGQSAMASVKRGLVAANGGFLSKYAVGIYSNTPRAFVHADNAALQQQLARSTPPAVVSSAQGSGHIESYTIDWHRSGQPKKVVVVGRLQTSGERFIAHSEAEDGVTLQSAVDVDPMGRTVTVKPAAAGNEFQFAE